MLKQIVRAVFVSLLAAGTVSFAQDGAATYKSKCQMCHGADGTGQYARREVYKGRVRSVIRTW